MENPISSVSTPALIDQITELAGHLNAAHARWLALIAELDRRNAWAEWGVKSCAHWLNWKCGLDLGAAREKLRVTHALIALHATAHHVEKLVRSYRRVQESQELTREARQQAGRELYWFHDDDGSLVIRARLTAEAGALFIKALQVAEDAAPVENVSAETSLNPVQTRRALRADALAMISESFLASGPQELNGGDRQQIVVHVDAQTLKHDHAGRKTRTIPPAIRRALNSRDRGCRFPGCTHIRYVDGHHIRHWAQGGETKLSNLVTLCRFHHRQVHEGQIVVQILDDGAFRFVRPDGNTFDSPLPKVTGWTALAATQPVVITPRTAITGWTGERLDYRQAIDWLLQHSGA